MAHRQITPHPLLQPYIQCLWISERDFQPPYQSFEILPDSYIELIFTFGAPAFLDSGGVRHPLPSCAVIGLLDKPIRFQAEGLVQTLGVRFYAWGFALFFKTDVQELHRTIRPLAPPWQKLAAELEAIIQQRGLDRALDHLHASLLDHILPQQDDAPVIQKIARHIATQAGPVRIRALAEQYAYSPRQLERKFNQTTGLPPKALARRMRFERVRDQLVRDPDQILAALAQEYGYADQAHLAREFKHYSQKTPTQFAHEMRMLRQWMGDMYAVVFFQDNPPAS